MIRGFKIMHFKDDNLRNVWHQTCYLVGEIFQLFTDEHGTAVPEE